MKRLIDHGAAPDRLAIEAVRLARAARELDPAPALKSRIRARLLDRERRQVEWRLRPWAVAVMIASMLAIAGATVGRGLLHHDAPPGLPPIVLTDCEGSATSHVTAKVEAPPLLRSVVVRAHPEPVTPAAAQDREPDDVSLPEVTAPEAILVVEATRALHTAHDPSRALTLLAEYLQRYPHGALVEESLALAIEAASARGEKLAGVYARAYLNQFPTGRFEKSARAALARFGE